MCQMEQRLTDEEYKAKWPNYCKVCNGWGGKYIHGTFWEPPDFDYCNRCIEDMKCPRCGKDYDHLGIETDYPSDSCPHCGWDAKTRGVDYEDEVEVIPCT